VYSALAILAAYIIVAEQPANVGARLIPGRRVVGVTEQHFAILHRYAYRA